MCGAFMKFMFDSKDDIPVSQILLFLDICVKMSSTKKQCHLLFCPLYNHCDVPSTSIAWGSKIRGRCVQSQSIKRKEAKDALSFADTASFVVISKNED